MIVRQVVPKLKNFNRVVVVSDDMWNGYPKSQFNVTYQKGNIVVANTVFRTSTGQIGWIDAKTKLLKEEILFDIVSIMCMQKTPPMNIWQFSQDNKNEIYTKWGFEWKKPVHYTVTGPGFSHNLQHLFMKNF